MKVPKMYKSSERYDAGVDVIYDDDSKLEYAPFIYATTGSGDSGGDGGDDGDDEEGEEFMIIKFVDDSLDKTWGEISVALSAGKIPVIFLAYDEVGGGEIYYIDRVSVVDGTYSVFAHSVEGETVYSMLFSADSDSSTLTYIDDNP